MLVTGKMIKVTIDTGLNIDVCEFMFPGTVANESTQMWTVTDERDADFYVAERTGLNL